MQLCDFWWDNERKPYPSKKTLGERLSLSPRQVQRYIAELEKAGLVQRIERRAGHGGKLTNIYDLSGLVNRLKELEPEFRDVEKKDPLARRFPLQTEERPTEKLNPGRIPKAEADPGFTRSECQRSGHKSIPSRTRGRSWKSWRGRYRPSAWAHTLWRHTVTRARRLQLYTWNTAISAAFYSLLQGLEVTLRNAIHVQLAGKYGLAWYDNRAAGLDKAPWKRIGTAKAHFKGKVYATEATRIVASLSFGFWVAMLGSGGRIDDSGGKANYEMTLWRPALRKAFPHYKPLIRKQVHAPLSDLRTLRNRIAHHEPIFARQLRTIMSAFLR